MLKRIAALNPVHNKISTIVFSSLFLANSAYYAYHAIFTPFIRQPINYRVAYLFLLVVFALLSFARSKTENLGWKRIPTTLVLSLLPSAILLTFGYFSYPEKFGNNARFFSNLIIATSSFIAFLKIFGSGFFSGIKIKNLFHDKKERDGKRLGLLVISVLFVVIASNLAFGTYHLGKFAAVDEPLWTFGRIPKFWNNTLDGEWQKTMISDKPGITVALLSGIGLLWTDPKEYKLVEEENEIKITAGEIEKMNFPMRFPILLFNALILIVFYHLLSKLFNSHIALLSVALIGLSPILLGMSRIINPDSLFWVFSSLSLLIFFLSIKNPRNAYLFLSGIFLGFSLLTKYVANFLFVFYFGMIFVDFLLNKSHESKKWKDYFKKALKNYLAIVYFSILTFFAFLPAAWVNLGRIAEGTFLSEAFSSFWPVFLAVAAVFSIEAWFLKGAIFGPVLGFFSKNKDAILKIILFVFLASIVLSALNVFFEMQWINFEDVLASPKSSILNPKGLVGAFLADFYPLIFGIHPIALFSAVMMLAALAFKNKLPSGWKDENGIWIAYILLFIFVYYLASFLSKVGATVRYQIAVYPLFLIISAAGLYFILEKLGKKTKIAAIGIVILLLMISLENIRPFYFSYASEILPRKYVLNLKDMGDGSYEAAKYLNSLPDAENLIVWTDKRGVCYFFKGGCFNALEMNKGAKIDYFVVSAGRQSRTIRLMPTKGRDNDFEIRLDKIYEMDDYEYKLDIGGRPNNFIKIFSYKSLSESKNDPESDPE